VLHNQEAASSATDITPGVNNARLRCRWVKLANGEGVDMTQTGKTIRVGATAFFMVGMCVWAEAPQPKYHPPKLTQAGSIVYPINAQQPGFVSLNVHVGSDGSVQQVNVAQDAPPLTSAVQTALTSWQFSPATLNGQAAPGIVPVDVAFNPFNPSGVGLPGGSFQPPLSAASGDYQPAAWQSANYANYPPNTVASGTVALQVHVSSSGQINKVQVLRGKGVLAAPSVAAVKTWSFAPATYKGNAVGSDVVVAFVYASPQAGTR
jgi:TonB family protein